VPEAWVANYASWDLMRPVEIELIKTELDMPHSTAYKYLRRLEEMDILTRDEDVSPTTVTADPIHLQLNWIPNMLSSVPHPS
jgi:DNA-binding IclR family transcriptional regulator